MHRSSRRLSHPQDYHIHIICKATKGPTFAKIIGEAEDKLAEDLPINLSRGIFASFKHDFGPFLIAYESKHSVS